LATSSSIRERRSSNSGEEAACDVSTLTPPSLKLRPDPGLGLEPLEVLLVARLGRRRLARRNSCSVGARQRLVPSLVLCETWFPNGLRG
jgi:hypothetical protein